MKQRLKGLMLSLALLGVTSAWAIVSPPQLDNIELLIAQRNYEEALRQQLAFHESSRNSIGLAAMRLGRALTLWRDLADRYRPAREALRSTRDALEPTLLSERGEADLFQEYLALSLALGDEDKPYQLFKTLDRDQPVLARKCYFLAENLLVKKGDYSVCAHYMDNPLQIFEEARMLRERNLQLSKTQVHLDNAAFRARVNDTFIQKTLTLIDILEHLNKPNVAAEIRARALECIDSPKLRKAP